MRNIFESLPFRNRREAETPKPDSQQIITRAAVNYFLAREKELLALTGKMREIRAEVNFSGPLWLALGRNITDKGEQEYRSEEDSAVAEFDQDAIFLVGQSAWNAIKLSALKSAVAFWDEKLKDPDHSFDEIRLAQERITTLQEEITAIEKPKGK
ncbi:MAG: hypothetical protein ACM3IJ_00130 [Candidatus Levyibacteriota bacterium]